MASHMLVLFLASLALVHGAPDQPWEPKKTIDCTPWSWQVCKKEGKKEWKVGVNKAGGGGMQAPGHWINGEFSLDMKLPEGYSGGTNFAWYLMDTISANNKDPMHSEIDMEFYGNKTSDDIMLALNVFANGKQNLAQFNLPFDPSEDYHTYTIRWTPKQIVWLVDNNILRILDKEAGQPWPMHSMKPMATVWATPWTEMKADFTKGPIYAHYANYKADGCKVLAKAVQKLPTQCGTANDPWNSIIKKGTPAMAAYKAYHAKTLIVDYGWDNV